MAQLPPSERPETPKKRNIGGRARKITMSLQEWWDETTAVSRRGYNDGWDDAREALREEMTVELQGELEAFDPECPLCMATRDIRDLEARLRVMKIELDDARQRARGRIMREGRYPYRET